MVRRRRRHERRLDRTVQAGQVLEAPATRRIARRGVPPGEPLDLLLFDELQAAVEHLLAELDERSRWVGTQLLAGARFPAIAAELHLNRRQAGYLAHQVRNFLQNRLRAWRGRGARPDGGARGRPRKAP